MDADDPAHPGAVLLSADHGVEDPQQEVGYRREQHRGGGRNVPEFVQSGQQGRDAQLHDETDGPVSDRGTSNNSHARLRQ